MSSFSSLIIGAAGITAISLLAFGLGYSKTKKLSEEDIKDALKKYDVSLKFVKSAISRNGEIAIANCENGEKYVFRVMGDEIAIRKLENGNYRIEGTRFFYTANDFSFPNYKADFAQDDLRICHD